jgi:hypothetical protein
MGRGREGGAALVEFAFVLPLLLVLLVGIVELGVGLRDQLAMSNAVTSAARIGSVLGRNDIADIGILDAVEAGLVRAVDLDVVKKVIVYEANADGSSTGNENHYVYDPTDPTCPWNPCPDPTHPGFAGYGSPEGWVPADRGTALPEPDILGLKIEYRHEWATTLIPFMRTPADWTAEARIRLEPEVYGS